MSTPAYDLAPALDLLLVGAAIAAVPLTVWGWRHRRAEPRARLRALAALTLFLTFDLVVFGAFTRLTDSGLGCPDWPGCYGEATPLAAHADIAAAQAAQPTGPVTHGKAWVEMVHRYLATGVGGLIVVLAVASWVAWRRGDRAARPGWAGLTLLWVCAQGAFGALTVTMKLYPAIVTLHLLGGLGLLALLTLQWERLQPAAPQVLPAPPSLRIVLGLVCVLTVVQIALGGWVSTNYAVLACQEFPTCQGQWWPETQFAEGFQWQRELGRSASGDWLPFPALTAIHLAHRLFAIVASLGVLLLAVLLRRRARATGDLAGGRLAAALFAVVGWQWLSGLSNVILGWPLIAALAHTAGAAALVVVLTRVVARPTPAPATAGARADPSSAPSPSGPTGARRLHHV